MNLLVLCVASVCEIDRSGEPIGECKSIKRMENLQRLDDDQLVLRLAEGEGHALSVLWERHAGWLRAIASSYARSDEQVNELLQEILSRIFRSAPTYTPMSSFPSWARRLAKNAGIDFVRRRDRLRKRIAEDDVVELDLPDVRFTPEDVLESKLLRESMRRAIEKLPERQRIAVIMRYFGAMSIKDIAWATRAPEGTVKSRLHTAMSSIRHRLEEDSRSLEDKHD